MFKEEWFKQTEDDSVYCFFSSMNKREDAEGEEEDVGEEQNATTNLIALVKWIISICFVFGTAQITAFFHRMFQEQPGHTKDIQEHPTDIDGYLGGKEKETVVDRIRPHQTSRVDGVDAV